MPHKHPDTKSGPRIDAPMVSVGVTGLSGLRQRWIWDVNSKLQWVMLLTSLVWPLFAFPCSPSSQAHPLFAQAQLDTEVREKMSPACSSLKSSSQHLHGHNLILHLTSLFSSLSPDLCHPLQRFGIMFWLLLPDSYLLRGDESGTNFFCMWPYPLREHRENVLQENFSACQKAAAIQRQTTIVTQTHTYEQFRVSN